MDVAGILLGIAGVVTALAGAWSTIQRERRLNRRVRELEHDDEE